MRAILKGNKIFLVFGLLLVSSMALAQSETAPVGGNAMSASREGTVPVNNYTGLPTISVPLYRYAGSPGLPLSLSLDYYSGGIKPSDMPATAGLGWNVNVGGVVTRTIRGLADDIIDGGYLYTAVLTDDERLRAYNHGMKCDDTEQDIYQFNLNGQGGSFYIGKGGKIIATPGSNVRISVQMDTIEDPEFIPIGDQVGGIRSFKIITADGTHYVFNNIEYQAAKGMGCRSSVLYTYGSAWYLTNMIAPYSKDTITFSYKTFKQVAWSLLPQVHKISGAGSTHSSTGEDSITVYNRVPVKIRFPDSTYMEFTYNDRQLLNRIKFGDSIFRHGYMLNWDTSVSGMQRRDYLLGVNQYTPDKLMPGYNFTYDTPYYPRPFYYPHSLLLNERDHFGFYNGLNIGVFNTVPTVSGTYTGVDRTVNSNAKASSLTSVKDPSGGITYYKFENNDVLPVTNSSQYISINAAVNTSNSVTITKDHSKLCPFVISFSQTFNRTATIPISGAGNLVFYITSLDGLTTYFTTTIDLKALYYNGSALVNAVLPGGSYYIKTNLQSGTTSSGSLPIYVSWYNQTATGSSSSLAGGIRIKQITHFDPLYNKIDTLVTYKYVTADGKSSGRGGQVPVYDYITTQLSLTAGTVYAGSVYNNIVSNPADIFSFAEPSFVGYKRVEVYRGSLTHNLGKEVYEYMGADEGYINTDPVSFPFLPRPAKSWATGLPKRVLMYDSLNRLIKITQNTYAVTDLDLSSDPNFRSLKYTQVSSNTPTLPSIDMDAVINYTGTWYFPQMGNAALTAMADTFYHPDNSYTASRQFFEYDSRYNIKKVTTDYDKTRGLSMEKRMYYPYDYTINGPVATLRKDSVNIPVSTETWIVGDGNPRMIAGDVTNFITTSVLKSGGFILPAARYSFESNKPVVQATAGTFDPAVLIRNYNYWKPQDTLVWDFTLLRRKQVTDKRTGFVSSVLYGYKGKKLPVAQISNAEHAAIAYSSFETDEQNGWTIPAFTPYTASSITGDRAYPLSAGTIVKNSLNPAETYTITYWLKSGSAISNYYFSSVLQDSQNGWDFYMASFTGLSGIAINGTGYIDELRLYPKKASMVTSTYNRLGQVTSVCDANNTVVYNIYDSLNRLKLVRDKDLNIVKKYEFPSDIIHINTTPNWVAVTPASYACELDPVTFYNTGMKLKLEYDNNYYSETFRIQRYVPDVVSLPQCPLPPADCGLDYRYKSILGVCELGCKQYTSSIYHRITDPMTGGQVYRWICTWRYKWSDNSVSPDYTEINLTPCALTTICEL